jgi:hypothetical protein
MEVDKLEGEDCVKWHLPYREESRVPAIIEQSVISTQEMIMVNK